MWRTEIEYWPTSIMRGDRTKIPYNVGIMRSFVWQRCFSCRQSDEVIRVTLLLPDRVSRQHRPGLRWSVGATEWAKGKLWLYQKKKRSHVSSSDVRKQIFSFFLLIFRRFIPLIYYFLRHCRWRHSSTVVAHSVCAYTFIGLAGTNEKRVFPYTIDNTVQFDFMFFLYRPVRKGFLSVLYCGNTTIISRRPVDMQNTTR